MYAELKQMPHTKEQRKLHRVANKPRLMLVQRAYDLRRNYGITADKYNTMFQEQNGSCALCGKHQSEFKRRLHVDHDHKTGEVRALLCTRCNPLIGYAQEDVARLEAAIAYLKKFKK